MQGPAPGDAEHVVLGEPFGEQRRAGRSELPGVPDDQRLPQPVGLGQPGGQVQVDLGRDRDLDPDHAVAQRPVQDPGHLEPGDAQLIADLLLGPLVQIETAGNESGDQVFHFTASCCTMD